LAISIFQQTEAKCRPRTEFDFVVVDAAAFIMLLEEEGCDENVIYICENSSMKNSTIIHGAFSREKDC
jgi:hypothetical protein